jgi:transcriptional regulator with XRE-family HTH domain
MAKGSASTVKGEGCLVHTEFRRSPIWSSGQSIAGTPEAWDNMRMVDGDGIGRRIATYRRRRGLSQAALAGLVGRSESWLSQVERGIRSVDRMSLLLDLARVLHVEVDSLIGRPWQLAPNGNTIAGGLSDVRAVLTSYYSLLARPSVQVSDLTELRSKVAEVHRPTRPRAMTTS